MSWPLVAPSKTKHFFENSTSFLKLVIFINSMCMLCTARAYVPRAKSYRALPNLSHRGCKNCDHHRKNRYKSCNVALWTRALNHGADATITFPDMMIGKFATSHKVPTWAKAQRNPGCESGITCLYTDLSQQRPQPNNNALGTVTAIFIFFADTTGDRALGNRRYQMW